MISCSIIQKARIYIFYILEIRPLIDFGEDFGYEYMEGDVKICLEEDMVDIFFEDLFNVLEAIDEE